MTEMPAVQQRSGPCRLKTPAQPGISWAPAAWDSPQHSVVDQYHRAHDVRNLFIVDGSSFVTSGRNQPTCTIQALAYRAAEHMIHAAKKANL